LLNHKLRMNEDKSKPTAAALQPVLILRRLDYLPPWLAITLGVCLSLGAVLVPASSLVAVMSFVALLGIAIALAHGGEPIAEIIRELKPEPPPPKPVEPSPPERPSLVELVDIPAGVFDMGSTEFDWSQPVHEVHVPAFRCMRYLVTRRLYKKIIGNDPGWPEGEADERPVNQVSWYDAIEFCNRLSEKEGLQPCYHEEAGGMWQCDSSADGYRLPTETEWEYACRAGTQTRYSFSDDESELGDYAWFDKNSNGQPHPVGQKKRNPWGLYDMHGNVWEWVQDCYHDSYKDASADGSAWETGNCQRRVLRGGSFGNWAWNLRSAYRGWNSPGSRGGYGGFRCVRGSRRQP